MTNPQIAIIGAGNLAWHLAQAFDNAAYVVKEVYSRKQKNAKKLIDRLYQAEWHADLDFSNSHSQLFVLAVSDDSIEEIISTIKLPNKAIIVHTSGSEPMTVFKKGSADNWGVFYPLQTFSKGIHVDMSDVPICIESNNSHTQRILKKLAKQVSNSVIEIDSEKRQWLHLSAVFACNFANHLFTISNQLLEERNLSFDLLKPLIVETINKSLELGPKKAQTGPAKRGDMDILESQLK